MKLLAALAVTVATLPAASPTASWAATASLVDAPCTATCQTAADPTCAVAGQDASPAPADASPAVPAPARFELPPGAAANAVARLEPTTKPARTPEDLGGEGRVPGVAPGAWSKPETWETWAKGIAAANSRAGAGAVGGAATDDAVREAAARRARLALLALEQGRSDDAWEHFAATTPEWTAALLPRFLPGVPLQTRAGVGGASGPTKAGDVHSPALPPPSLERVAGRVDRRAMSARDVTIGDTVVSVRVSVEAEGVQVDVRHRSGPATRLALRIPRSPDYDFGDEYVDWYRQETKGVPHVIEVKPGEEEHTLYGRFDARRDVPAASVPTRLPPSLARGGLWLVVANDDPDRELLAAAAAAIGRTGLGFECGLRSPGAPSSGIAGTSVDLSNREERAARLAWLVSAIEHYALGLAGSR